MTAIYKIIPASSDARDPKAHPVIAPIEESFSPDMYRQSELLFKMSEEKDAERIAAQWQILPMTLAFLSARRRNPCKYIGMSDVFEWFGAPYVFSSVVSQIIDGLCHDMVELLPIKCCGHRLYAVRPLLTVTGDHLDEIRSEFWFNGKRSFLIKAEFKTDITSTDKPLFFSFGVPSDREKLYINDPLRKSLESHGGIRGAQIVPANSLDDQDVRMMEDHQLMKRRPGPAPRPSNVTDESDEVVAKLRVQAERGFRLLGCREFNNMSKMLDAHLGSLHAVWDQYNKSHENQVRVCAAVLAVLLIDKYGGRLVRLCYDGVRQPIKNIVLMPDGRRCVLYLEFARAIAVRGGVAEVQDLLKRMSQSEAISENFIIIQ